MVLAWRKIRCDNMIREIFVATSESHHIQIPKEYLNQEVEVLILPFSRETKDKQLDKIEEIFAQTAGLLKSKGIDPLKWQEEMRFEREI